MRDNFERTIQILKILEYCRITDNEVVSGYKYVKTEQRFPFPKVDESWQNYDGEPLSGYDTHYLLYKHVIVPERMIGKNLYLELDTGITGADSCAPQFLVYIDDELSKTFDINHKEIALNSGKKEFDLFLSAYTGTTTPDWFTHKYGVPSFTFSTKIIQVDPIVEKLYYDLSVPFDVLKYTCESDAAYFTITRALGEAENLLDLREPFSAEFNSSVIKASEYMDKEFYGKLCSRTKPSVVCIGHTHIDIAWLWTIDQTREKAQRSFGTVASLMKQYPEYKFMSSQAVLYKMVKRDNPPLYEEIKRLVKEGRWEVEGSMWVEADCNLPSGESLIRQVVKGKRFFKDEFGVETKILWLPDVFGYSAALPQILKKCGVDYFVTSKISWNDRNKMPYDVFRWKGIDGSEVFTTFLTAQTMSKNGEAPNVTTYVALGEPSYLAGSWNRFQQKGNTDEVCITYGYGDGGGGPTKQHIESIKRMTYGIPNCPTAKFDTATNYVSRLCERNKTDKYLPTWSGELYLEFHRGTYTSQAKNKRNNRKIEYALLNAEYLSVLACELRGRTYPKDKLDEIWETTLTNQFHDIIPGSSIKPVYERTDREYKEMFEGLSAIAKDALSEICSSVKNDGGYIVFNPHSFTADGIVKADGKSRFAEGVPPKGYKVFKDLSINGEVVCRKNSIENRFYKIVFDKNYEICSIYDKECDREIVPKGKRANKLRTYEDLPCGFDAWEIRSYYKEKYWDILNVKKVESFDDGARKGIRITREYLKSSITQEISLYDGIKRIDFITEAEWNTEHVLLKALFPHNVHAEKATYNIQFGNLERNLCSNTSWDEAKFEVCAHKFADVSEGDFGISLMNDCKYGYSADEGEIALTLIKCPTWPAENADKGLHRFTYSLYSHGGDFSRSQTVRSSYLLNNPMFALPIKANESGKLPNAYSFLRSDSDNVIVETIKLAERGDDIIVRLYESENKRTQVTLYGELFIGKVYFADMLENELQEAETHEGSLSFEINPYEIITLKVKRNTQAKQD